jgi:hypothetical protein
MIIAIIISIILLVALSLLGGKHSQSALIYYLTLD